MEPETKSNGSLVGLIIIIIILVIGGIYVWQSNNKTIKENGPVESVTEQDSADLNSLEADVSATDTTTGVDINAVN